MDDLVAIARIVRARGLKGELVAEILTDFPERFEGLTDVTAVMPDATRRELKIEDHWFQKDRIVLKFVDHDSVEAAETLRDADICVGQDQTVELAPDEYYDWELVGCRVETVDGLMIGTVRELMRTGGNELLVVDGDREYLIPFARTICIEVDIEKRLVRIDPPDGLLEF
ncbi:MAG: ribosome maturation factor RimM [Pyrinomonadaceae bacterium]